jgi:hypothetical protein
MTADRTPAAAGDLAGLLRSALGAGASLRHVTRVHGSSKKGVYRAVMDGGRTAIVYRLAMHLSLVAGPLRLLDGDFPDREPMLEIVAYNTRQACLDIGVTGA